VVKFLDLYQRTLKMLGGISRPATSYPRPVFDPELRPKGARVEGSQGKTNPLPKKGNPSIAVEEEKGFSP